MSSWPYAFKTFYPSISLSFLDANFDQLTSASTSTVSLAGAALVGFVQSGSGAVAGTVQAQLQKFAFLSDYSSAANFTTAAAALNDEVAFSATDNPVMLLKSTNTTGANTRGLKATATLNSTSGNIYGALWTAEDTAGNTGNHIVAFETNSHTENTAANVSSAFGMVAGAKFKGSGTYSGYGFRAERADSANYPGVWNYGFGTNDGDAAIAFGAGKVSASGSCLSQPIYFKSNNGSADLNAQFFTNSTGEFLMVPGATTVASHLAGPFRADTYILIGTPTFVEALTVNGNIAPTTDAAQTCGNGTHRWLRVYCNTLHTSAPTTNTSASYTVLTTDSTIINNVAGTVTLTLPTASNFTGRHLRVLTYTANTVISGSSNVVPITGGSAGTAILAATAGKWADLESNGTNWVITASN